MDKKQRRLQENALKVLKKIEDYGYKAYIVGGFVRDLKLKRKTLDVDIATNATPKELKEIFKDNFLPHEEYGSIAVGIQGIYYEITTFRKEITYKDNRKPIEFDYIDNLEEDLQRRDFIINTLCMDKSGKIIDHLGAMKDIKEKTIRTVGNSNDKFNQDVLRILRAIRFATVLNFKLSDEIKKAILENKYLLKNLSLDRKKKELEKIFTSKNVKYGIDLILELGLDEYLELPKLKDLTYFGDLCGIWSYLEPNDYPFTKNERQIISKIKSASGKDLKNPLVLYEYDPYILMVAADMSNQNKKEVLKRYSHLPIKSRKELELDGEEIMKLLSIEEGPLIKEILKDIETQVLRKKVKNKKLDLKKYVVKHYKKC